VPQQPYDIEVNGKAVTVTIEEWVYEGSSGFHIVSTAAGDPTGTRVDAYVVARSQTGYAGILQHVITAYDRLDLPNNPNVEIIPSAGENGPTDHYKDKGDWPDTPEEINALKDFYRRQVTKAYYVDCEIDLRGNNCPPGPIYINGQGLTYTSGLEPLYMDKSLTVQNSKNPQASLCLNGTLYVRGNLTMTPTHKIILDLKKNTIFVEGEFKIDKSVGVRGPGCIIAIGDIDFKPGIDAGDAPVFIMSVNGTTKIQPGVNFYGCIAGKVLVDIDPSANVRIEYPGEEGWYEELNFPVGSSGSGGQSTYYTIVGCRISQQ